MTNSLISLAQQLSYLYNHITVGQVVDISLMALVFFVAFQALYQTRALQLLRGVIIAAILGGGLIMLMPLATLSWLVRIVLIGGAIAIPILFQDELRWALVGLGQFGRRRLYSSDYARFKHTLISALSRIASAQRGGFDRAGGANPPGRDHRHRHPAASRGGDARAAGDDFLPQYADARRGGGDARRPAGGCQLYFAGAVRNRPASGTWACATGRRWG